MGSESDNRKFGLRRLYSKISNSPKYLRYLYVLALCLILLIFFPSKNLSLERNSRNHNTHFMKTMGSATSKASSKSPTRVFSSITDAAIMPNDISIIYGTAWKKDRTKELVMNAIKEGFRVIDTACQPKHYNEKLVGEAIQEAIGEDLLQRKHLFIQTKFTSVRDHLVS